ncbi:C40 family peptidase [Kitasatospora sp. NBC_01539]|uniref:C40 family peptidase n=1 Tax=Kitasatospora sp. NBC_01539 TaxID=2903577 RepID=UPI0038600D44
MTIAAGSGLIGFAEAVPADCRCGPCVEALRVRPAGGPAARSAGRRTLRSVCLSAAVLAGLGAGAPAAQAFPVPDGPGWDGARYWFRNADGVWRYTTRPGVYEARPRPLAASASSAPARGPASSASVSAPAVARPALRQGWDGARYWFRNAEGAWRYTAHRSVYLDRTGRSQGAGADARRESAVAFALAQLGRPYLWGGDGPGGFDCSGLVQQAYRRAGVVLPRVADDQYAATTPVAADRLSRGDLLFWSDTGRASGIEHVALYLGDGRYVEAPRPGRSVRIAVLTADRYPTHFGRP